MRLAVLDPSSEDNLEIYKKEVSLWLVQLPVVLELAQNRVVLLRPMRVFNHATIVIQHVKLDVIVHVAEHVKHHALPVELSVHLDAVLNVNLVVVLNVIKTAVKNVKVNADPAVLVIALVAVKDHVEKHVKDHAKTAVKTIVQVAQAVQEPVMRDVMICAETVQGIVLLPAQMHAVIIVTENVEIAVVRDVLHHVPDVHHHVFMIVVRVAEIYVRPHALLFVVQHALINVEDAGLVVTTFVQDSVAGVVYQDASEIANIHV